MSDDGSDDGSDMCLLCANPCRAYGAFECGHYTCHVCALRVRRMALKAAGVAASHGGAASSGRGSSSSVSTVPMSCPACRHSSSKLFIVTERPAESDAYDTTLFISLKQTPLPELGAIFVEMVPSTGDDDEAATHTSADAVLSELRILDGNYCPFDECWPDGMQVPFDRRDILYAHLRTDHAVSYCECCIDYRPCFLSEQTVYTAAELQQHLKGKCAKDSDAFTGHPRCLFCKRNIYDGDSLLKHMNMTHVTCDMCNVGEFKFTYYKDHAALTRHFEVQHKLCAHRDCAHKPPIGRVFKNDFDLQAHNAKEHGASKKVGLDALGFKFGTSMAVETRGGAAAAASSRPDGAPATGANIQATHIFFDFVTHTDDVRLVPQRRDDDVLAERDRVRGAANAEEQQETDRILKQRLTSFLKPDVLVTFQQASMKYLEGRLLATEYYKIFRDLFKRQEEHDLVFEPLVRSLPNALKRDALVKAKQMMTSPEEVKRRQAAQEDDRTKRQSNTKAIHRALHELQQKKGGSASKGAAMKATLAKASQKTPVSWAAAASAGTGTSTSTAEAALAPVLQRGTRGAWQASAGPPPPPQTLASAPSLMPVSPPTFADPSAFPALASNNRRTPGGKKAAAVNNAWFAKK